MRALKLRSDREIMNGPQRNAAEPMAATCNLIGHSGAHVVLHSNGMDSFVRKTAVSIAASPRLMAQADKQHALWMFGLPFPKVRTQGSNAEGIARFDMNYIPGRTIADAVANGATFDPAAVVRAVKRMMWLFVTSAGEPLPRALFKAKIGEVEHRATAIIEDPGLLRHVRDCGQALKARDWAGIPETPCHGDLTLENILLTAGKSIAFIDCDESFASSFWLDFGKLFQDLDGHWCIRALYGPNQVPARLLNAAQKLEQLGPRFRHLAAELDPRLALLLPQLSALGLYRAIPYAREPALVSFVCHRIDRILGT
jgi:aminoglycoside phosphotransferase